MDEDEVQIETEDPEATEGFEKKASKMKDELAQCRKEKQEYMDGWQRAKADYVNVLKRFEGDLASAQQSGMMKAVEVLLPALDAVERSKEHGEIPEGFLAIVKQLEGAFSSLGLEEIGKEGEVFEPLFHDALGQDEVPTAETDNTVTAVLEKGWKIGTTVIRPAKVRVGTFASKE